MTVKQSPLCERPREKLVRYGAEKLSLPELIAVILGTGKRGTDVLALSRQAVQQITPERFAHTGIGDLQSAGLGYVHALRIAAAIELGRRVLLGKETRLILSPRAVWERMHDVHTARKEYCVIFYLDARNQEIRREIISVGTVDRSIVHPREVFEPAVRCSAVQIILAHTHPSGSVDPSVQDIALTRRLVSAGELLGIELLDHIIVTKTAFTSMKEQGLLKYLPTE